MDILPARRWERRRIGNAGLDARIFERSENVISTSRIRSFSIVAVVVFITANGALAWAFPYIPGSDGPSHLNVAAIFFDLMQPNGSLNEAFYQVRPYFYTNYAVEAISFPLLSWLGPLIVEKIIFTILIVGVPLGIMACMLAAGGRVFPLALFAVPYGYPTALLGGNYNYLIGVIIGLLILSGYIRTTLPPSKLTVATLAVCWVIMGLVHPAATIAFMVYSGFAVLGRLVIEYRNGRPLLVRSMLLCGLTVVPEIALLIVFLSTSPPGDIEYQKSLYMRVRELIDQWELYKLDRTEIIFCLALSLSFLVMIVGAIRTGRSKPYFKEYHLLILIVAAALLYFVAPNKMSGGDQFVSRIEIFPYIFLLVWVSCQNLNRYWITSLVILGLVVNMGFTSIAYRVHKIATDDMRSYFQLASMIPERTIVLPITGDMKIAAPPAIQLNMKTEPYLHLYNDIAIERHSVFLQNWNAHFRVANVMYKSERDPYTKLWQDDLARGMVEYERDTGVPIQFVLLWRVERNAKTAQLLEVLNERYEPVSTQPDRLVTGLYRRRQ